MALSCTATDAAAASLGISRQALSDMARRLGLPSRAKNYASRKRGTDADFIAMWQAGVSLEDMARHFGYASLRGVCSRRAALGLPKRTRGGKQRRWRETITLTEWRDEQMSERMASDAAVARQAVRDAQRRAAA